MTPKELFDKLKNTDNIYSFFQRGRKYIYFSTGGWSENEELIRELEQELVFNILLVKWRRGGHYTFSIPSKDLWDYNFKITTRKAKKISLNEAKKLVIDKSFICVDKNIHFGALHVIYIRDVLDFLNFFEFEHKKNVKKSKRGKNNE